MNYEIEDIRRRCEQLSVEELIREAFVNGQDYELEPQRVMREALARRVGDVRQYFKRERAAMGEEIARIAGVKNFGRGSDRYMGTLILASQGLGFLPTEKERVETLVPEFVSHVIYSAIEAQLAKSVDHPPDEQVPLPILARIFDRVVWCRLADLAVELNGAVLAIREQGAKGPWGLIQEKDRTVVESWGQRTGVPVTRVVHQGVWQTVKGWFR